MSARLIIIILSVIIHTKFNKARLNDATAHELGITDPVQVLYDCCDKLTGGQRSKQRVMVAQEPDGRQYGPAIFRVHYGGHDYQPHINHVGQSPRARELHALATKGGNVPDYAAFRFDHQLAALICIQHTTVRLDSSKTLNGTPTTATPQAVIHRLRPNEGSQQSLAAGTFGAYLDDNGIPSATLEVEPGDFYIFNSGLLHEVPIVPSGGAARIVLATFIGYSEDDPEIFVWA
jgi:hypothetical protein